MAECRELHFFDVDHTITDCVTSVQYLFQGISHRQFPLRPLLSIPGMLADYREGHLALDTFFQNGIPFIVGKQKAQLERLAQQTFLARLSKKIFLDAYTQIIDLQQRGREVVLATSSIDFIVEPLRIFLGVQRAICSSLRFEGDICTGQFDGQLAYGPVKKQRVLDFVAQRRVDPADCYFYSDSINDLPLLLEIGHPVIINPDRKLRREARQRGWPVQRYRKRLTVRSEQTVSN